MKFSTLALKELARQGKLFVGFSSNGRQVLSEEYRVTAHAYVKLSPGDIAEALQARPWVSGMNWDAIGPGKQATCLAVTPSNDIYACINASTAPSTVVPQGKQQHWTSDKYGWQWIASVSPANQQKFGWSGLASFDALKSLGVVCYETAPLAGMTGPVKARTLPVSAPCSVNVDVNGKPVSVTHAIGVLDYSTNHYAVVEPSSSSVQTATLVPSIANGQVTAVAVAAGGGGYTDCKLTVFGDGVGAVLTPVVAGGVITGVTVATPGTGYTWMDVVATLSTGRVLRAIVPDTESLFPTKTLVSKAFSAISDTGPTNTTAFLAVSDDSFQGGVFRGLAGDQSIGDLMSSKISVISRLSEYGAVSLRVSLQINTVITPG